MPVKSSIISTRQHLSARCASGSQSSCQRRSAHAGRAARDQISRAKKPAVGSRCFKVTSQRERFGGKEASEKGRIHAPRTYLSFDSVVALLMKTKVCKCSTVARSPASMIDPPAPRRSFIVGLNYLFVIRAQPQLPGRLYGTSSSFLWTMNSSKLIPRVFFIGRPSFVLLVLGTKFTVSAHVLISLLQ